MKSKTLILAGLLTCIVSTAGPASAGLVSGTCILSVTISFPSKLTLTSTSNYSMSVSAFGAQTCAVTLSGLTPLRSTSITVDEDTGSSSSLNCASIDASGEWTQSWTPATPAQVTSAQYHLRGTPDALTMDIVANDLSFVGAIELVGPFSALARTQCTGTGISSLSFTGVEVFQGS